MATNTVTGVLVCSDGTNIPSRQNWPRELNRT